MLSDQLSQCAACPFCGSHDLAVNGHGAYTVVICCGCLSEGPHGHLQQAITAWNARAAPDAQPADHPVSEDELSEWFDEWMMGTRSFSDTLLAKYNITRRTEG